MDLRTLYLAFLLIGALPALRGTVVDESGRPLDRAEVTLSRRDEPDASAARQDAHRARAAAAGTFSVPGLSSGAGYDVLVTHPGYAPALIPVSIPKQGSPIGLEVVLRRGRTAHGTVVDSRGRPVEGARIELVRSRVGRIMAGTGPPLAEDGLYRSTSGRDGGFDLPSLPPGRFDLRIEGDGFAPLERTGLEIPAGGANALVELGRFFVERGLVQTGRVVDPEGRPLRGAEVWIVPRAPRDWTAYYKEGPAAVSGPEGEVALADLPHDGEISLDVCRQGYLTESLTLRELTPEPFRVVLEPAARLLGRVTDPGGHPVAGAQIRAWLSGESPDRPASVRPCHLHDGSAETDAEGRFVLESLPPGWWTVRADAAGWLSAETERRQVLAGASLEGVEIMLGEGAVLAGRVLSPDGAPLAGAEVRAYNEHGNPRAVTAGDGTYRLPGVAPGERTVEATHLDHEFSSRTLTVSAGENRLDLKLGASRRSKIRGRVFGPDGRPLAGASVVTPGSSSVWSAADGSFVLLERDGTYEIWADKDGYAPGHRILGLAPGERAKGIWAAGPHGAIRQGDLDQEAGYAVYGLIPGDWKITATFQGREAVGRVTVEEGETEVGLDLEFAP